MGKPIKKIEKSIQVGIWGDCDCIARIYADKIIITEPIVRWRNNTGSLSTKKWAIRSPKLIALILQDTNDDCIDEAWSRIEAESYYNY